MRLLKYNPKTKVITEVPFVDDGADPECHYIHTAADRISIPIYTREGFGEIIWQSPDYKPPKPLIRRRPWHMRLLRFPLLARQNMRLGLPLLSAIRISLPLLKP